MPFMTPLVGVPCFLLKSYISCPDANRSTPFQSMQISLPVSMATAYIGIESSVFLFAARSVSLRSTPLRPFVLLFSDFNIYDPKNNNTNGRSGMERSGMERSSDEVGSAKPTSKLSIRILHDEVEQFMRK